MTSSAPAQDAGQRSQRRQALIYGRVTDNRAPWEETQASAANAANDITDASAALISESARDSQAPRGRETRANAANAANAANDLSDASAALISERVVGRPAS